MKTIFAILILFSQCACKNKENPEIEMKKTEINYLALGDSYTIGQSVLANESFPIQLQNMLNEASDFKVNETKIIAQTGWTTQNLIDALNKENITHKYDLVTLLIGVNNQYQENDTNEYAIQFEQLLNSSIYYADGNKKHVIVVSIPDYGFTSFGAANKENISKEIDEYNAINKRITMKYNIKYVDITPISRSNESGWVANDGLHPSGKQYKLWAEKIKENISK